MFHGVFGEDAGIGHQTDSRGGGKGRVGKERGTSQALALTEVVKRGVWGAAKLDNVQGGWERKGFENEYMIKENNVSRWVIGGGEPLRDFIVIGNVWGKSEITRIDSGKGFGKAN